MSDLDLELIVDGKSYGGWTSVRVTRSIEAIAGSFEFESSERWASVLDWPLQAEDECVVQLAGQGPLLTANAPLITGWIDRRTHETAAERHTLSFAGRDKTSALIDCTLEPKSYGHIGVFEFCTAIAKPFGIPVSLQGGLDDGAITSNAATKGGNKKTGGSTGVSSQTKIGTAKDNTNIGPGETAFTAIDRACRAVGVLPIADGRGGLLLTAAGALICRTGLIDGQNLLSAHLEYDATQRFRKYIVYGQAENSLGQYTPEFATNVRGTAEDPGVRRADRILHLPSENGSLELAFAIARAKWEAKVRAARAVRVSVTVQGWTQRDGTLWPVNALVDVQSPRLGIKDTLLITEATYHLSDQEGSTTALSLMWPDAFLQEPVHTGAKSGTPIAGFVGGLN